MEAAVATGNSEEGGRGEIAAKIAHMEEIYEFSAPRFFDFLNQETEDQIRNAEIWFERGLSYAQSPFVSNVKGKRKSYTKESICCDLGKIEEPEVPLSENSDLPVEKHDPETIEKISIAESEDTCVIKEAAVPSEKLESKEDEKKSEEENGDQTAPASLRSNLSVLDNELPVATPPKEEPLRNTIPSAEIDVVSDLNDKLCSSVAQSQACDAKTPTYCRKAERPQAENGSKKKTAKKIASLIKNPSSVKPRIQSSGTGGDITIGQENQAIKRQKLEGGFSRQIHSVKNRSLIHKSRPDLPADGGDLLLPSGVNRLNKKEEIRRRPMLTLTRPKEPELETAHRVRAIRIKSSAELEEEMLSKIPKFKARPINKKILEAPSMPTMHRSIPHPPEFQEFNLETMKRASRNAGPPRSAASSSIESSSLLHEDHCKMKRLTEPKTPVLETSLRARPPRVKSSQELELEELEKIPKFKARPLNKKIFESKGERVISIPRPKITIPQEFHFATNERLGAPVFVFEAFDKLSLHSEGKCERRQAPPRLTIPNPFHLHTEERGLEKERDLDLRIQRKEMEQEKARVPKANPYPYTTDYPVFPSKPTPKECTKPEGFQLESLIRHEEVLQMKMEELERMEREEAQKRIFKAQPILINRDPFPTAKRERKPLTEVQGFDLQVDHRATERSEFDKKIKEKETMYKRLREESEAAKKIEEEREVKQMRKTMVPPARPLPTFVNPFLPQKSTKEITKPKSPALKVAMRLMMRRQQLHSHPTSSLSQMR